MATRARKTVNKPAAPTKVLTVRQPWASLIVAGVKRVENRSWPTRYRGRLWVHAAQSRPEGWSWEDVLADFGLAVPQGLPAWDDLPSGAVVGSVEVYDCLDVDAVEDAFAGGPWCWMLRDPRPLAVPFTCKGSLGLWTPPKGLRLP
jgi:hypothetical protein